MRVYCSRSCRLSRAPNTRYLYTFFCADCRRLAKLLDNKKSVPELESFMTLYCKKRNVDYKKDSGWLVVLEKMLKFDLPQEHLFNIFFAFTTKYIPKETRENAQIYDLFRLLLQYHDPQISSHLDSLKCTPYTYANPWFSTVLASGVDDAVCRSLWELYIDKLPYLVLPTTFACSVLIQFLALYRDEANKILAVLPNQLSIEDVSDFVQLSAYYAERTPQCVREDLHYLIFGSNYDDEVGEVQVSKLLCLPVTLQELMRKERSAVTVRLFIYIYVCCFCLFAILLVCFHISFLSASQMMYFRPGFDLQGGSNRVVDGVGVWAIRRLFWADNVRKLVGTPLLHDLQNPGR
ncbi:unnamed protein product [Heligmosomoides polygyrus]|uniref:Rab-GAP TBC domain-containing protein n=1 Tax=Heligmosomoides polygyrus TaxID=6339 RepID=A0A183GDH4_HELPZ|nr:unnamed protein product [Heligmosomoides polygyrus]